MGTADDLWGRFIQAMQSRQSSMGAQVDPQLLQSYQAMLAIDPSAFAPAGVQAGQQYGTLAGQGQQASNALNQAGMDDIGRGQQIWQNAQDPLGQQFEDQRGKVLENTRSAQSARGIAMGDYGAGLEGDQLNNFGLDWKRFQDQRMMDANQSVNASNWGARQNFGQGMSMGAQVPGYTMAAAQAPIAGQEMTAQWPAQAAMQYAGNVSGSDPYAAILAQLGNYMRNTYGIFGANPSFRAGQTSSGMGNIMSGMPALSNSWDSFKGLFGGGGGGSAAAGAASGLDTAAGGAAASGGDALAAVDWGSILEGVGTVALAA